MTKPPRTKQGDAAYEAIKERAGARSKAMSLSGRDIGPIPDVVNPERRAACAASFRLHCVTYHADLFWRPFSPLHEKLFEDIQFAIMVGRMKAVAVFRGFGKSTFCELGVEWGTMNGHVMFALLLAATADAATKNLDNIYERVTSTDLLLEDYPEICFPIRALEDIPQRARGQLCEGERTRIKITSDALQLPWVPREDRPGCGAMILTMGLGGAVKGLNFTLPDKRHIRPSVALIDDIQTRASAMSPTKTKVVLKTLARDVRYLSDAGSPMSALMACTVCERGDAADQLLDRGEHPEWAGERHPMMTSFPTNENLWDQYAELFRSELRDQATHDVSNAFYAEHRAEMDESASVSWPELFNPDTEQSGIQHAMNLKIEDEGAFYSEAQNQPPSDEDIETGLLSADEIAARLSAHPQACVPSDTAHITAMIDVHQKLLYWEVVAWQDDFTGCTIDYGVWPKQKSRNFTLRNVKRTLARVYPGGFEASLRSGLDALAEHILGREWLEADGTPHRIARCLVDANWGQSTNLVYEFCRMSPHAAVLTPSHGKYVGASNRPFHEYTKKKGDRTGLHWRMPKPKRGRVRHVTIDTNYWKTFVHTRFADAPGTTGSLTLYGRRADIHQSYAEHMVAEYRVQTEGRDRKVDEWQIRASHADNHWFDCLVGCAVAASICGAHLAGTAKSASGRRTKRVRYEDVKRGR